MSSLCCYYLSSALLFFIIFLSLVLPSTSPSSSPRCLKSSMGLSLFQPHFVFFLFRIIHYYYFFIFTSEIYKKEKKIMKQTKICDRSCTNGVGSYQSVVLCVHTFSKHSLIVISFFTGVNINKIFLKILFNQFVTGV